MNGYHYVYPLQSVNFTQEHYTGQTDDLQRRLAEHNAGIRSATAFRDKAKAIAFERY